MKLLRVVPSPLKTKKWRAEFVQNGNKYNRDFGAKGYIDYTLIDNPVEAKETRERYWNRHKKELGSAPDSPGMLSLFILWGWSQDMKYNIAKYKKLYNL